MPDGALSLFLSRLDFAWITTFHIIYPPLTIGLAIFLFLAEWRWIATEDEHWYRLVRFFERLFIVNFAAGVATGITMKMAFGILYGPFSQAAGPFFGQVAILPYSARYKKHAPSIAVGAHRSSKSLSKIIFSLSKGVVA